MIELSTEAAVALAIAMAGLVSWLTNMSFKLGSIKSAIEKTQTSHSEQLETHKMKLENHEIRITALEN